jgi:hypothetical protein
MEFVERIKEEILEVSQRRKNVTLEEILRIASRLEGLCTVQPPHHPRGDPPSGIKAAEGLLR